jgi:hypothetical protein
MTCSASPDQPANLVCLNPDYLVQSLVSPTSSQPAIRIVVQEALPPDFEAFPTEFSLLVA